MGAGIAKTPSAISCSPIAAANDTSKLPTRAKKAAVRRVALLSDERSHVFAAGGEEFQLALIKPQADGWDGPVFCGDDREVGRTGESQW
jgi:hypothetical protein